MDEKEFLFKLAALTLRAKVAEMTSHTVGERTKELLFSYEEAIAKADLAQLKVMLAAMKLTLVDVEADLAGLDTLSQEVGTLAGGGDTFTAHYQEVKDLVARVSEARRKATTRALPLKSGIHDVEVGLVKLADGKTELLDAWAKIDAKVRERSAAVDDERVRLDKIKVKAAAAKTGHDGAGLKSLQQEAGGIGALLEAAFTWALDSAMADFNKRLAHNPTLAQTAEMVRQKAETQKLIAAIAERTKANAKLRGEIVALKVDPVDLAKVARELGGIAANLLPRLEKALALEPTGMLKAIEGVLKEAGRNMTAKDAVSKLKKAKLLPP